MGQRLSAFSQIIVFIKDINPCIYGNSREQNKRGESALVKIQIPNIECQKDADERNRNGQNNSEGLSQRIEQNRGSKKDNGNEQSQ